MTTYGPLRGIAAAEAEADSGEEEAVVAADLVASAADVQVEGEQVDRGEGLNAEC